MSRYLSVFEPSGMTQVAPGISIRPLLSDELSRELDVTYVAICFSIPTHLHHHEKTTEVFRFYDSGRFVFEGREFEIEEGSFIYVPPRKRHKIIPPDGCALRAMLLTIPGFDPSDEYADE
ncbi:MAG: hypothetical protein HYW25_04875 [Candidatus Aenigmarchaeota archaeon]|nr:hypothetical protein [Candidatus Aenigmarchaeota archaeon]